MSAANNSAPPPVLYSDLARVCPNILHKEAVDTNGGGQASYASYKDSGQYIYIQLCDAPKKGGVGDITLPFGISPIYTGKGKKGSRGGNVAAVDPEKKAAYDKRKNVDLGLLPKHVEAIEAFENWNIKDLAANSEAVFDKKFSEAKIRERWTSSLKRPEDDEEEEEDGAEKKEKKQKVVEKTKQQTFRIRLRTKLNCVGAMVPKISVMQPNGKRVAGTWEDLNKPRSTCIIVVRYSGRWFSSGKVGTTFEISNALVFPVVDEQPEFPFVWNSDEAPPDKDEEMPQAPGGGPAGNLPALPSPPPPNDGAAATAPNSDAVMDYKFTLAD